MADSPWFDFAQVASNNLLRLNQQKQMEQDAIRQQANLIFQQERQKALENHYMDMAKHQAQTDLQAAINAKAKADKEEKDRQHQLYKGFMEDYNKLTEKGGEKPGPAFVKALAGQGFSPTDKDTPESLLKIRDDIWKEHQKSLPPTPSPGVGTATMPVQQPPQLMPGMPGGGIVGTPQPAPIQAGMAPNVNMQPAMATAPPAAFPQTQEEYESSYVNPVFAEQLRKTKAIEDAKAANIALGQKRVDNAIKATTSLIDARKLDRELRKSNYESLERNRKSLEKFRLIAGKSIQKNDVMKQKALSSLMGFRDAEVAKMGVDVLNNWDKLDQTDRRIWQDESDFAQRNWKELNDQVSTLNNELIKLREVEDRERNSRTFPDDPADQEKLLAPLAQRRRVIDELLNGRIIGDPINGFDRDPQNPGANQQLEDAKARMDAMPSKAQTDRKGKIVPPVLQKGMIKGALPSIGLGGQVGGFIDARPPGQRTEINPSDWASQFVPKR